MNNELEGIYNIININKYGIKVDNNRKCKIMPLDERIEVGVPDDGYIIYFEEVKSINIDIINATITYVD